MYQNKTFTRKMQYYQTAQKPVALYDNSDLSVWNNKNDLILNSTPENRL